MASYASIARPYARALFELAQAQGMVENWLEKLQQARPFLEDANLQAFLNHPKISFDQKIALLRDLFAEQESWLEHLLSLLLVEKKTLIFSDLVSLFEAHRNAEQNRLMVTVESAYPLEDSAVAHLTGLLGKHFSVHQVSANVTYNPALIAGIKIHIGDKTIDASARGQLEQLAASIRK